MCVCVCVCVCLCECELGGGGGANAQKRREFAHNINYRSHLCLKAGSQLGNTCTWNLNVIEPITLKTDTQQW